MFSIYDFLKYVKKKKEEEKQQNNLIISFFVVFPFFKVILENCLGIWFSMKLESKKGMSRLRLEKMI